MAQRLWRRLAGTAFGEAGFILALCLGLTAVGWWAVERQSRAFAEQRFETIAHGVADSVVKRMGDYEQILRGAAALMEASEHVTRAEWRAFVGRLAVHERYPGIQGIGFAVRIPAGGVGAHEQAVRAEGFPDYGVNPPGLRADYFPIVYLDPFDLRNRRAFGYDMFAEPIRRAAMTLARDTGAPSLSGPVTLVQELAEDVQKGTLLYLPVYEGGVDPGTPAARRRAIAGFVYSPFRMGDLMRGILAERLNDVAVRLHDTSRRAETLLFSHGDEHRTSFQHQISIDLYGRHWDMTVTALLPLEAELSSKVPTLVLISGFVISLLSMWLARSKVRERQRSLALERSNHDLAQARLLAETARGQAETANAAKSKFLAAASHDIRQPVQSMMLLIEVLAQQLGNHPAHRLLDPLDKSLDALRMLLNGLLDISKLEAGVVEARIEPVALGPLLERLAAEYRIRAEGKGLELRLAKTDAWVLSDPAQLERILRNLLENALRYTETGRILVGCRRRGAQARITVTDTGIGIAADQLEHIFTEFYQVANPERDRSQGLGLGLAIVERLAHMLGHGVEVRSRPGRGSCFVVTAPRTAPPPAIAPTETGTVAAGAGVLVLVVDDEAMVRDGFRDLLESWGFSVVAAASEQDAVDAVAARNLRPGLILADYRLRGGETGTDAIARIRRVTGRHVPAVVVTGDTAPERIVDAERGDHRLLHKPVLPAELRAAVEEALSQPA